MVLYIFYRRSCFDILRVIYSLYAYPERQRTQNGCKKYGGNVQLFSERAVCCAYDWIFAVRNIQGLHNRKRQNGVYVFRVCLYGFGGDAVYYVLSRAFGTALFTGVCVALASLVSDLGAYLRLLTIYFAEYAGFL